MTKKVDSKKVPKKTAAPVRLWVKSVFVGFKRSKVNQNEKQALLKIQGVDDQKDTKFYLGKRVAYIYKANDQIHQKKYKCIWGRIAKSHGTNGITIARFAKNLPPRAMGATLRVMLYPNRT